MDSVIQLSFVLWLAEHAVVWSVWMVIDGPSVYAVLRVSVKTGTQMPALILADDAS